MTVPQNSGAPPSVIFTPSTQQPISDGVVTYEQLGGGRSIKLDISGPDLGQVLATAGDAIQRVESVMPRAEGNQYRPIPGLELGAPELRVIPDPVRIADNGLTATGLAQSIDAYNSGLRVTEITVDGGTVVKSF